MKRKIAIITATIALVMGAFLLGKSMSKTESPKDTLALSEVTSTVYDINENKLVISTQSDKYEFEPTIKDTDDGICRIYNSSELSKETLTHRDGKLIIERCVGVVTNSNKNGKLKDGNYISYANVKCKQGDKIITYLIYNPQTNSIDDVTARYDFVKGER